MTRQLAFQFDDPARARTKLALREAVGARIARDFSSGVRFDELFAAICNETPATKAMLGEAVTSLCGYGDLEKHGGARSAGTDNETEGRRHGPARTPAHVVVRPATKAVIVTDLASVIDARVSLAQVTGRSHEPGDPGSDHPRPWPHDPAETSAAGHMCLATGSTYRR